MRSTRWRALGALLLLAGLTALGAAWRSSADDSLATRLSAGCDELEACRQLEAEAARRERACWIGCGRRQAEHRLARSLRYRAEERSAVREHYRQREDAERNERQLEQERRLAEERRAQAAEAARAEREHRERMELERLRQDRIDRRLAEERQRRVAYLALLEPAARRSKLERCHARKAGCEQLVLELIDAAPEPEEKRELVALNEELLSGNARPAPPAKPRRAPAEQASPPARPAPSS